MLHPSAVIVHQMFYLVWAYGLIHLGMHNGTSNRNLESDQILQPMCLEYKAKPRIKDVHLSTPGF